LATSASAVIDPHWGTQTITEVLTNHGFEGLYSLDEKYSHPDARRSDAPRLADGLTYNDQAAQRAFKFHNGKELTSVDVVASLVR